MKRALIIAAAAAATALAAPVGGWAQDYHDGHDKGGHDGGGRDGRNHGAPAGGREGGAHGAPAAGGWDRRANPGAWGATRGQWRSSNGGWARSAVWARGGGWWRGRPAFRGFYGPRAGFWFVPGVGYWAVPAAYFGRQWYSGQYLPNVFWRYSVADYWDYGLPAPPYGCAWVWLNGGVALVDMSDGYILDVQYGLW